MKRRDLLGAGLALASAALAAPNARAAAASRARPGAPGWPKDADWDALKRATGGRLAPVTLPDLTAPDAKALLANPFYVADQPGLSQSSGWLAAGRSAPRPYVVAAENTADIVAAVNFARAHNLRLVIKGRGHSFFGASNAPDLRCWSGPGTWTTSRSTTPSPPPVRNQRRSRRCRAALAPCGCTPTRP